MKSVAFVITSTSDNVLSIDGTAYNCSISALIQGHPQFWLQADGNGVQDLCTQIPTTQQNISGSFVHAGTSYMLVTTDFIGGRPNDR